MSYVRVGLAFMVCCVGLVMYWSPSLQRMMQTRVRMVPKLTTHTNYTHVSISAVDGAVLTWEGALERMQSDEEFRLLLTNVLQNMTYKSFFWECAPVSKSTARLRPFEFVTLPAPQLTGMVADPEPFSEQLEAFRGQPVIKTFQNLGGDSILLSPAQATANADDYAHIAIFFRNAPAGQHGSMWVELGKAIERRLAEVSSNTTLWVSSEGLGVNWLHMRLDPKPKYYHHGVYRDPNFGVPNRSSL